MLACSSHIEALDILCKVYLHGVNPTSLQSLLTGAFLLLRLVYFDYNKGVVIIEVRT